MIGTVVIFLVIGTSFAVDYCDPNFCDYQDGNVYNHIACNNTGELSQSCSPGTVIIPIDDDLKDVILKISNQMREKIAGGDIEGFPAAERMPIIEWDPELAKFADLNVKKCVAERDECVNTEICTYAGQNIAVSTGLTELDIKSEIVGILHSWFNENKLVDPSIITSYRKPEDLNSTYEHFTVMVNHKVNKIGCAVSKSVVNRENFDRTAVQLTCNYGYTNIEDEPAYVAGVPCTRCATGCDNIFKSLCTKQEIVRPVPDFFLQKIRI